MIELTEKHLRRLLTEVYTDAFYTAVKIYTDMSPSPTEEEALKDYVSGVVVRYMSRLHEYNEDGV